VSPHVLMRCLARSSLPSHSLNPPEVLGSRHVLWTYGRQGGEGRRVGTQGRGIDGQIGGEDRQSLDLRICQAGGH